MSPPHVIGHDTAKSFRKIYSDKWYKSSDASLNNIKIKAVELNANAIVSLKIEKSKRSEPSNNGKGTYYYTGYKASGRPVIIEKQ